jgi:hypothetical protein
MKTWHGWMEEPAETALTWWGLAVYVAVALVLAGAGFFVAGKILELAK